MFKKNIDATRSFFVVIPIVETASISDGDTYMYTNLLPNVEPARDRKTTILLVEDNEMIREALRDLLEALHPDWHVVEAENGLQGIEVAGQFHPDAIVLDFNMPVMNGYEMALSLQSDPETSQIPLILNSSEDQTNPLIVRLRSMCSAVLNKPFSLQDIENVFSDNFVQLQKSRLHFASMLQALPA